MRSFLPPLEQEVPQGPVARAGLNVKLIVGPTGLFSLTVDLEPGLLGPVALVKSGEVHTAFGQKVHQHTATATTK